MAYFFPKGELLMPYDVAMLEKTVAASNGRMIPGCKFSVTMYSAETPTMWSLPVVFRGKYHSVDEGVRIKYRVLPGPIVWLLLMLPVAAMVAMILLDFELEKGATIFGLLLAAVCFVFGFQRMKAIERFQKRFGK